MYLPRTGNSGILTNAAKGQQYLGYDVNEEPLFSFKRKGGILGSINSV